MRYDFTTEGRLRQAWDDARRVGGAQSLLVTVVSNNSVGGVFSLDSPPGRDGLAR